MSVLAVTQMDPLEANEMAQVERRLIAELSPAVLPEEVQRCVRDVVARFDAATIRKCVPLLVERIARDWLQAARVTPTPADFDQLDQRVPTT